MREYPSKPVFRNKRAIFLDRDGTINKDTHYPHKIDDLILLPSAAEGMELFSSMPLDIIVVSNQGGIALGFYTTEQMSNFNNELRRRINEKNGRIDAFYYCPHFESKNIPKNIDMCTCSKPLTGMLLEAVKDFSIDLNSSYMVGDRLTDIVAGNSAGCKTILIKTGQFFNKWYRTIEKPNFIAENLLEAANIIRNDLGVTT